MQAGDDVSRVEPGLQIEFSNWARTHRWTPRAWETPAREDDVVALVQRAQREGRRIKVVGSGHSWSDAAIGDDALLSLDRIDAVGRVDRGRGEVTVGAGIKLKHLVARLREVGMSPTIVGSIMEQSLAGAISTGTHGSSLVHGNLASFVRGVRVVTGRGDVLDLRAGDERLAAVRVAFGALGIITEVTLAVESSFTLVEEATPVPLREAIADIAEIAKSAEYTKIWWLPGVERALVYRYRRTSERHTATRWGRWLDEHVVSGRVFRGVLAIGARWPHTVPRLNRMVASTYLRASRVVGAPERVLTVAMPPIHRETEYAVAMTDASEALRRIADLIKREKLRVNLPVEARFVRADDAWMSPAYGRDTAQIGVYMADAPDLEAFFRGCSRELAPLGVRPHWGKELDTTAADVRAAFPMAARFIALRDEWDPNGVFDSPFLRRVLGPR